GVAGRCCCTADLRRSAISGALRGVGTWRKPFVILEFQPARVCSVELQDSCQTSGCKSPLRVRPTKSRCPCSVEDSANLPVHPSTAPSSTAENTPPSRKSQSRIHEDPELLLIWSASKPANVIHTLNSLKCSLYSSWLCPL
ncbi:hypothetical protein AMECASPLE_039372, partial [Ameca splendens]